MVFSNLFSSSFLFNIAIFILIGCILAYVNYKMTEQDHKLNSMIGLISTMAEEMHFFRSKLHNNNTTMNNLPATDKFQFASQMLGGSELIEVSDNEYEDDEDEEEGDDDEEDEEDDDDEEGDDDDEEGDDDDEMIELSLENLSEELENSDIVDLECINNDFEQNKSIKTIHLEQTFDLEETNLMTLNDNEIKEDNSFLKNVNMSDLDEDSKTDYKKMSVNKLREIAVNKGFTDASKLKKNDILKMLGEE